MLSFGGKPPSPLLDWGMLTFVLLIGVAAFILGLSLSHDEGYRQGWHAGQVQYYQKLVEHRKGIGQWKN